MFETFKNLVFSDFFSESHFWQNAVFGGDIIIVYIIIYKTLLLIRGTRAVQTLIGLFILLLAAVASRYFGMATLTWIFEQIVNPLSLIIIVIILFQDDIRKALGTFAFNPFVVRSQAADSIKQMSEIVQSCLILAKNSIGALLVLERNASLSEYLKSGTVINGNISKELLLSIFEPASPLHDGAVIIQKGKISAAGCIINYIAPDENIPKDLGTRHRAAIALSQNLDAVVLVVSEERGEIGMVVGGKFTRALDEATLTKVLNKLFTWEKEKRTKLSAKK